MSMTARNNPATIISNVQKLHMYGFYFIFFCKCTIHVKPPGALVRGFCFVFIILHTGQYIYKYMQKKGDIYALRIRLGRLNHLI